MKKYLVIGSYGAGNLGDEALLETILKILDKDKLSVLSGNLKDTKKRHKVSAFSHFPFGIRSFLSFSWIKSFQRLLKTDLVIFGGGGLFTDSYSKKAVFLWFYHCLICKLFNKPYIFLANSFGPVNNKLCLFLTKKAIIWSKKIIVRDKISADFIDKLSLNKEVIVNTDLVFAYPYLKNKNLKNKKKSIAFNVRDLKKIKFEDLKKWINSKKDYYILGIAMEKEDLLILERHFPKIKRIYPKNYAELLDILSTCEYFVGMRLHFLIAGILLEKKILALSYSSKVKGIMKELDISYLELENLSQKELVKKFQALSSKSPKKLLNLAKKLPDLLKKNKI
jgi:N-acetylglucosaminyldiphosphoundecaprenol N-acetyl-beta-D-mannosaminyltransferase